LLEKSKEGRKEGRGAHGIVMSILICLGKPCPIVHVTITPATSIYVATKLSFKTPDFNNALI
jgi:hypothetical protein